MRPITFLALVAFVCGGRRLEASKAASGREGMATPRYDDRDELIRVSIRF